MIGISNPLELRNMSVAPKTTISHRGTGLGRRLIVELPVPLDDPTSERVLDLLEANPRHLRGAAAERELHQLIDAVTERLPLPSAAPVRQDLDVPESRAVRCNDLAEIVAILARSSDRVYLREKSPIVSGIRSGRRVILVLPDDVEGGHS